MPVQPVAKLALDTRAHGPYFCEECESENEDALLMSDATVVCPECKAVMLEFEQFSEAIVSAAPVQQKKTSRLDKWIIKWSGPDTSRDDATVAYDSREEALKAAAGWVKQQADDELNGIGWDEGAEEPEFLKDILRDVNEGNHLDAVRKWLDYQGDFDPQEKMSIGPSGFVSDSSSDLS